MYVRNVYSDVQVCGLQQLALVGQLNRTVYITAESNHTSST